MVRARHPRILSSSEAVLFIIDVQEAFRKVLVDFDSLCKNIAIMAQAAKIIDIPVVITEQYPRGLGATVPEIAEHVGKHEYFDKSCFSALALDSLLDWLRKSGRTQVILSGIEAHVCVSQTAHDLLHNGYQVHLITDAIQSRIPSNKEVGLSKMIGSGAVPSSVEAALFEMLMESGTDAFKAVQKLVK